MSDSHLAAARRNGAGNDFVGPQKIKPNRRGDDVNDRIDRSDFVEVNLVDRRAMHFGFGGRNGFEDSPGEILLPGRKRVGELNDCIDIGQMPMRVLFGMFDREVNRPKTAAHHRLRYEFDSRQAQGIDGGTKRAGIDASINQRRDGHIAADAGRTVEIREAHSVSLNLLENENDGEFARF
jgi:hypothetical protein